MTDPTAQEPTMEEILASIRRIISEDDAPVAAPEPVAEAAPAPEPAPFPTAVSPALMDETPSMQTPEASDEDVLELTDEYEAPAAHSIGDLDVSEPEAPAWAPEPAATPASSSYDGLVGESAAASAASAFAGLHASLKKPEPTPSAAPTGDLSFLSGSTVEGMVAEMLKPLLKGWLDANLPGIVDAAVKKEVERISRSAG
ncbi:pole-organizing protein PopZ [soil metagenome]